MRRKRKNEGKKGAPEWMATFSDLVTLLLCFFILLFSFSEIDAQKFQAMMKSFNGSPSVFDGGKTVEDAPLTNNDNLPEDMTSNEIMEYEDFIKLKKQIEKYAEEKGLGSKVVAEVEERGLVIRVLDNVFFDSGKATIKSGAKEVLLYIGDMLKIEDIQGKHIKIEGHTDSDPLINTSTFASNWELSGARASSVLRFLLDKKNINSNRISFAGYAYYRPVAPNDTKENKAKNRRVDIVILKSFFSKWEPN